MRPYRNEPKEIEMKVRNYRQVEPEKAAEAAGVTVRVVIGEEEGAPNFVMRVFDVEPGAVTPLHTHHWEHEVFVLAGRGRVSGGGEEAVFGRGTPSSSLPTRSTVSSTTVTSRYASSASCLCSRRSEMAK